MLVRHGGPEVQHVARLAPRRVAGTGAGRTALGLPGVDAFQAVDAAAPEHALLIAIRTHAEAIGGGQRLCQPAAFHRRDVVGAATVIQREELFELPCGDRRVAEAAGDVDIARYRAVAGHVGFQLVVETVELARHRQPGRAQIVIAAFIGATVIVVEAGNVVMQASAEFGGNVVVGVRNRHCGQQQQGGQRVALAESGHPFSLRYRVVEVAGRYQPAASHQ
ncbi:hypothetical protein D3C81_1220590 [compost metagenome]